MTRRNELRNGQKSAPWYLLNMLLNGQYLPALLFDASFIGGSWGNGNQRLPGFLGESHGFSMPRDNQRDVQFFGVEIEPINTPDVAIANSELRGAAIDTTNFFGISLSREEHSAEGNSLITPDDTLIERNVLTSRRKPPEAGVRLSNCYEPGNKEILQEVVGTSTMGIPLVRA